MNRRDTILTLLALGAGAAVQTKVRRIGFLTPRSCPLSPDRDAFSDAFTQGMRELGFGEIDILARQLHESASWIAVAPYFARNLAELLGGPRTQ
jgi:hypothetical protein